MSNYSKLKSELTIHDKIYLTLEEASALFGIGLNSMRKLCDKNENDLVLWVGEKRLVKKEKMREYLDKQYSI